MPKPQRDGVRVARFLLVLSSDAISADAGYRSPRESKRRGPAIGDEKGGLRPPPRPAFGFAQASWLPGVLWVTASEWSSAGAAESSN